jgi:hypothetical protein
MALLSKYIDSVTAGYRFENLVASGISQLKVYDAPSYARTSENIQAISGKKGVFKILIAADIVCSGCS